MSIFNQTCPIWFEEGAAGKIGEKALEYHTTRAFCICDKGISSCGIAEIIVSSLKQAGLDVYLYDEVLPDAPDTMINDIARIARSYAADLVVGIGGGSSLDAAKAVTILLDNPGEIRDYYMSAGTVFAEKLPLFCVPTAAGTGSEATSICVVHDMHTDIKETVIKGATLAIVDPKLMVGLPPYITAITAFDAMAHALEAYTSQGHNPHSDILALCAIRLITENIELAWEDGSNMAARSALAQASTFAGMAFNDSMVHVGHAMAHELGLRFHMPHGLACALTLPTLLRYFGEVIPERLFDIVDAMGIEAPAAATANEVAAMAETYIKMLMKKLKITSLKEQGRTLQEVTDCAEDAYNKAPFMMFAPSKTEIPELAGLLKDMYEKYQ